MATGAGSSGRHGQGVQGPSAVAAAMHVQDRHVRAIVRSAIAQQAMHGSNVATGVAAWHERVARLLHQIALEHGSEAMSAAAEYAVAAMEAQLLYAGEELDEFLKDVAAAVRATSRDISRHAPFA